MSRKRIKQYLMLLLAIGVIAVVASGSGTFATFQAETTNANNTFATGTLFLHDTANGTTCTSESASDNLATSSSCATLFKIPNLGPGDVKTAMLTLDNAGSVDSNAIKFYAPSCTPSLASVGTLNTTVTATTSVTQIKIDNLTQDLVHDTTIRLSDGTNTQDFVVATTTAHVVNGTTTVSVNTVTAGFTFAAGTGTVVQIPTNFGSPTNMCSALTLFIEELNPADDSVVRCVYGTTVGNPSCTSGTALNSLPTSPFSLNLTTGAPINLTGLPSGKSRKFKITVTAPGSLINADMNRQAKFDLTWHIEH